jgi:hypothetical protein
MVTLVKKIIGGLTLLFLTGCSALETMLYASGGAALGSLAGPGGAAAGAVVGVGAAELRQGEALHLELQEKLEAVPKSPWEAFVNSISNLLHAVGWWYLILFIFVPLLTKKGRNWFSHLIKLNDTVSKKDVDDYSTRLHKLEDMISSSKDKKK